MGDYWSERPVVLFYESSPQMAGPYGEGIDQTGNSPQQMARSFGGFVDPGKPHSSVGEWGQKPRVDRVDGNMQYIEPFLLITGQLSRACAFSELRFSPAEKHSFLVRSQRPTF